MKRRGEDSWTAKLERYPLVLTAAATLIAVGAGVGMAYAAGPHAVLDRLEQIAPVWLAVAAGARLLSYGGYTLAHRRVLAACAEEEMEAETAARVVAFGAGATSLRGGFSIDARALRGAGVGGAQARARVAALALLEYAVLSLGAWICALLLIGEPGVQAAAVWPWVIGVPTGTMLAAIAWPRLRRRARRPGAGARLRSLVRGGEILAGELRHPAGALAAVGGMTLYWAAEAGALWASLHAFGVAASAPVAVLGYATGFVLTPRGLPLAGAGISEVLLPLGLMWLGVPLAAAVPAALAAELVRLAISVPFAVESKGEVHRLVGLEKRVRERRSHRRPARAAGR